MKELRERIAKILDEHISAGICWDETQLDGGPKASVRGERIASAAIAEMVEEELDKQPALVVAKMAKLQAQLAEMSHWVQEIATEVGNYSLYSEQYDADGTLVLIGQLAKKALAAAPKDEE